MPEPIEPPKILKEKIYDRAFAASNATAKEALTRAGKKTYTALEVLEVFAAVNRAAREHLLLQEATR